MKQYKNKSKGKMEWALVGSGWTRSFSDLTAIADLGNNQMNLNIDRGRDLDGVKGLKTSKRALETHSK